MNKNKQLTKGKKMKKAILSLLVVLSLSAAVATPSNAYWKQSGNTWYWCEFGTFGLTCK